MIITDSLAPLGIRSAVAVGYFDGMHPGHMKVLKKALSVAAEHSLEPVLLTFDMRSIRAQGKGAKDLTPVAYRQEKADELGFSYYACPDFSVIVNMNEDEFISCVLSDCLGAEAIICGEDFRYGKGRCGDVRSLKESCLSRGIDVHVVSSLLLDGRAVSTSDIKKAVEDGKPEEAAKLLGSVYFLEGTVTRGNRLAHTLGFPTANVVIPTGLICPKKGVYLTNVTVDGNRYRGITNVGTRPTVTEDVIPVCETHILDYEGDLYGKMIRMEFLRFLRPEQKFLSVEDLCDAVEKNIKEARLSLMQGQFPLN